MMSDLKKSLKLLKYGYQIKTNISTALIFFLLALLQFFAGKGFSICLVSSYLLLVPLFSVQVSYGLLFSNMVGASFRKRSLDITFPTIMGAISSMVAFGATYLCLWVNPKMRMGSIAESGNVVIASAIIIAVILIFYGISFKYFVAGLAVFLVMFIGAMAGCGILVEGGGSTGLLFGSIVGVILVVAGNVLGGILRVAVYKYSLDPWAVGVSLRKAMK